MRRLFVPLVGLLVLLAGCSDGDPEPKIAPTDSSSAASSTSSSPSPSVSGPVEPSLPAEAEGDGAAAAEAFVAYFWEVADFAQGSGNTSLLSRLSTSACSACEGGLKFVRDVYAKGGSISGGETTTSDVEGLPIDYHGGAAFQVKLKVANTAQRVDLPGSVDDERFPAGTVDANFVVVRESGSWKVAFWEVA